MRKILTLVLATIGLWLLGLSSQAQHETEIRIGVLAHRGEAAAFRKWTPVADELSRRLNGRDVRIVPMTLDTAPRLLERREVDFLITNPGHYISLAPTFGLSVLATHVERTPDGRPLDRFGSVIVARGDENLRFLSDLRGRKVAAVSPKAFGGFQIAWREFTDRGIDPFKDFGALVFMGFPQDQIVRAVMDGTVDAGIVRTGLIEEMVAEGRLDAGQLRVLSPRMEPAFPLRLSTRLYPEWAFVSVPSTPREVVRKVTLAPLGDDRFQRMWEPPRSYEEARRLVEAFEAATGGGTSGEGDHLSHYLLGGLSALGLAVTGLLAAVILRLRREGARANAAAAAHAGNGTARSLNGTTEQEQAAADPRLTGLTNRELQVLELVGQGHPNKVIAHRLGISVKTVEFHRSNLMKKTGAGSSAELIRISLRRTET